MSSFQNLPYTEAHNLDLLFGLFFFKELINPIKGSRVKAYFNVYIFNDVILYYIS